MSNNYTPRSDETFEIVSRNVYGTDEYSSIIRQANPHVSAITGTVPAGTKIFIPAINPTQSSVRVDHEDEVTLSVAGTRIKYFETLTITHAVDGISQVAFNAPFDPEDPEHRELFRPFSYHVVELFVGNELQFRGTMITATPSAQVNRRQISLGAYATPGILNDCTPSAESFPVEFNKMKLEDIADALLQPFAVRVIPQEDTGAPFDRTAIEAGQKILPYLIGLAQQRNLIVSNTPSGALIFKRANTSGDTVVDLEEGLSPLVGVSSEFKQQGYYSSITGIQPTLMGFLGGDKYTEKNTLLGGAFRPYTFQANDTEEGTLKSAVVAKMSRMFGTMASYACEVVGWRDPKGDLWEPDTMISLVAPGAQIYTRYEFLISRVALTRTGETKKATLTLSLPGSYSGEIPARLPWVG